MTEMALTVMFLKCSYKCNTKCLLNWQVKLKKTHPGGDYSLWIKYARKSCLIGGFRDRLILVNHAQHCTMWVTLRRENVEKEDAERKQALKMLSVQLLGSYDSDMLKRSCIYVEKFYGLDTRKIKFFCHFKPSAAVKLEGQTFISKQMSLECTLTGLEISYFDV